MPVVSVTGESEARGLLKSRNFSPAWTTYQNLVSLKKKKEEEEEEKEKGKKNSRGFGLGLG
jgi:hypothetical protein